MPEPLRLGMAGLGVASTMVLPGIEQYPHARIVAAADLRASAREAFRRSTAAGRTPASKSCAPTPTST